MRLGVVLCFAAVFPAFARENIRGVPPSKADLYHNVDGLFRCLDGSKKIPYERLNDDYCDCEDGSDEPGTSACPNSTFFCQNAGHIPVYLPSNRVNDGVCEDSCCDGSDEWLGLVKCPNTCREKAKEHRKIEAIRESTRASGWKVKEEWRKKAHRLRSELMDESARVSAQLDAFRINLQDKEASLAKLESESTGAAASSTQEDVNLVLSRYQEAIKTLLEQVTEQRLRVEQYERIMADLSQGYNPNFQDMSVKGAVTSYNELRPLREPGLPEGSIQELMEITLEVPPICSKPSSAAWHSGPWTSLRTKLVDIGLLQREAIDASGVVETKQISNAKATIEKLREEVAQRERDASSLQSTLQENYGPDDVYRAVKGDCFSALISDYTYEVCLLDTLHQKSSSLSTLVGTFDHVDENGSLVYTRGQRCWNGPERSGRVDIECGVKHELLSVREAQKCEYVFRIKSPLACEAPASREKSVKGEL